MSEIRLHHELAAQGFAPSELARLVRSGELTRPRRGAYALSPPGADDGAAHRRLVAATMRQLCDGAVASHVSAAVLHGLPTWTDQLDRAHVTRDRSGGGKHLHNLQVHGVPLAESEVTTVDGIRVTNLARTVLDLACTWSLERSVAAADAALRAGLPPGELLDTIEAAVGRRGVVRARCVGEIADRRSESPGESFSRVRFWRWGLPTPKPQYVVLDAAGHFVARGDFGWPELGTIGEFDGDSKYGVLLKPGQTIQMAVLEEKRREERMRELGWQVVRWTWSDLANGTELVDRLEAAFRRGRNAAPHLRIR